MSIPTAQTHTPPSAVPQGQIVDQVSRQIQAAQLQAQYNKSRSASITPNVGPSRPVAPSVSGSYSPPPLSASTPPVSISQALRGGISPTPVSRPTSTYLSQALSQGLQPASNAAPSAAGRYVPPVQSLAGSASPLIGRLGGGSGIAAKNAAAAAGGTGAQVAAAARISPIAARQAFQAAPVVGSGFAGVVAAGTVRGTGGSWAEAALAGVGAAVGATIGQGIGLAVAAGSLGVGNPFIAAAAPLAGALGGATVGGELGRRTPSILGRIPGAGGAIAKGAGAIIPGAGLLYSGAGLLKGWLQPETVAGPAVPEATELVSGPSPFEGMQSPVRYVLHVDYSFSAFDCSGGNVFNGSSTNSVDGLVGPIVSIQQVTLQEGVCGPSQKGMRFTNAAGQTATVGMSGVTPGRGINYSGVTPRGVRADGQPDTGGNPPPIQIEQPASRPRTTAPITTPAQTSAPSSTFPAPNNNASQAPAIRPKAPPVNAPAAPNPGPALPAGDPLADPAPAANPTANPNPTAPPAATPANVPQKLPTPGKTIQPALQPGQTITLPGGTTITGTETGYKISSPTDSPSTIKLPDGQTLRPGESSFIEGLLNPALAPLLAIPALAIPALLSTPTTTTGKVTDPTTPGNFTQTPPVTPTPPVPTPPDNGCRCNGPILANQAAQAAELATLLAELERIKSAIGVHGLPASVPNQIAKKAGGQRMINSLAELHLWQVEQLDGVVGQWPIEIGVDTPGGNVGLTIPNMAEAMAEQMGLMIGQQVTSAQILNTASRTLAQSGSATQQAHLAHLTAKANADFLGYESRASAVDIPLAYTPGQQPFDGLLKESTAKIQGFENTDSTDIKAIFAELLQAAAIIRAVYWRKLDTKGDLKTQIRGNIRGQGDFIDKAAAGDGSDSDWEAYLKQVAEGFRGVTGDANPFNRPPTEGPQIKDRSPKKDGK